MARKEGWIINGNLVQFTEKEFQFLVGTMEKAYIRSELVPKVNMIVEMTPTDNNHNVPYSDRSHIITSYDTNGFQFHFRLGHVKQDPDKKIVLLENLVADWLNVSHNITGCLSEQIDQTYKLAQSKLSGNKHKIFTDREYVSRNLDLAGIGNVEIVYAPALESWPFEGHDLQKNARYMPNKDEFEITINGKLEKHNFNPSMKGIHDLGYQLIREIEWRVARRKGYVGKETGSINIPYRDYHEDPRIAVHLDKTGRDPNNFVGTINVIESLRKGHGMYDEEMYSLIRKKIEIPHEYIFDG